MKTFSEYSNPPLDKLTLREDTNTFDFKILSKFKTTIESKKFVKVEVERTPQRTEVRQALMDTLAKNNIACKLVDLGSKSSFDGVETEDGTVFYFKAAKGGSGGEPNATQWEAIISVAVNKLIGVSSWNRGKDWNIAQGFWDDYEKSAIGIGTNLLREITGIDKLEGVGSSKLPTNKLWKSSDGTPKTDIHSSKVNISLKKKGGSQLMSGKRDEAISTVEAAMRTYGSSSAGQKTVENLLKTMEEKMISLSEKDSVTKIDKLRDKTKLTQKEVEQIAELDQVRLDAKEINNEMDKVFKDMLFKAHFCFEAASGAEKFQPSPLGIAHQIITFDDSAGKVYNKLVLDSPEGAGMKLARSNNFYVSFKSSAGSAPYLAFRSKKLSVPITETFRNIVFEEMNKSKLLTEDFQKLNEWQVFQKLGQKIKDISVDTVNMFKKVFDAIMERVKKAFNYILTLGRRMIATLLNFFGVSISGVSISGGGDYPLA